MNVNKRDVHKRTLFICLHNSFLKKLLPQNFSVVVHCVPPKEIGRRSFATLPSIYISLTFS